ncbi:hypothetical protein WG66_016768 [Moniliophthora roreri]|nr:hypothetical protein WG66_016768 [Moniliophthora roreri]
MSDVPSDIVSSVLRTLRQIDHKISGLTDRHWAYTMHDSFWGKTDLLRRDYWDLPLNRLDTTEGRLFTLGYYRALEDRIEFIRKSRDGTEGGVVILGNPGGGKSTYLDFAYVRKLCAGEPIIYYFSGGVAIHWNDECFVTAIEKLPNAFFAAEVFKDVVALIESAKLQDPPNALVDRELVIFPVQAASPRQESAVQIVIDPPSDEDLHTILVQCTTQEISVAVAKWGRNIRTIRKVLRNGDAAQERRFRRDLASLTDEELNTLSRNPSSSPLCYTHSIVTTKADGEFPAPDDVCYTESDTMLHFVTSQYICRAFLQTVVLKKVQLEQFYFLLNCATNLGSTKGIVFENLAHQIVLNKKDLVMYRLFVKDGCLVKTGSPINASFFGTHPPNVSLYSFNTATTETRKPLVYNIPTESNNPTFDSYTIVPEDVSEDGAHGTAFQMTVGRDHSLKTKGLKVLMARFGPLQNGRKHDFVFVVPYGSEPKLPASTKAWANKFDFYILEIKSDQVTEDFLGYTDVDRPCDGDPELPPDTMQDVIEMEVDAE